MPVEWLVIPFYIQVIVMKQFPYFGDPSFKALEV